MCGPIPTPGFVRLWPCRSTFIPPGRPGPHRTGRRRDDRRHVKGEQDQPSVVRHDDAERVVLPDAGWSFVDSLSEHARNPGPRGPLVWTAGSLLIPKWAAIVRMDKMTSHSFARPAWAWIASPRPRSSADTQPIEPRHSAKQRHDCEVPKRSNKRRPMSCSRLRASRSHVNLYTLRKSAPEPARKLPGEHPNCANFALWEGDRAVLERHRYSPLRSPDRGISPSIRSTSG